VAQGPTRQGWEGKKTTELRNGRRGTAGFDDAEGPLLKSRTADGIRTEASKGWGESQAIGMEQGEGKGSGQWGGR